jgi:hypothetical protein
VRDHAQVPVDVFDQEPDDAPEELLYTPARSRWWGALIVATVIAAVTVWALTRHSDAPSPRHLLARPTPTASAVVDPACQGLAGCSVRVGVPPTIARLARVYLPAGAHLQVRTAVAPGSLPEETVFVGREIDAQIDSVTVLIRVQRGGSGTQAIAPDPLGVGSLVLHRTIAGFVVRLQYLAPETVPPMLARLRALIRDPRLTSG